jgi:hypothetical protein
MWLLALVAGAVVVTAAACGGGDSGNDGVPQLEGTPLPTATPPTCTVTEPLALPANFPADVAVPPNYLISSIDTEPLLRLEGRIDPPADPTGVRSPIQMLEFAIADNMLDWTFGENQSVGGLDHTFTHPDGRSGRYTSGLVDGCPPYHLSLSYEIPWITPQPGG